MPSVGWSTAYALESNVSSSGHFFHWLHLPLHFMQVEVRRICINSGHGLETYWVVLHNSFLVK